jgi:hypothetical protein
MQLKLLASNEAPSTGLNTVSAPPASMTMPERHRMRAQSVVSARSICSVVQMVRGGKVWRYCAG